MKTWAIGAAVLCAGAPVLGAEFDYRGSLGAGYSDNVRRTPTDEVDETIAMAGLRFSLFEDSSRVQADVVGDLGYYEYLNNTYDAELVGSVYADTAFALIQDRLSWTLNDQFGQVAIDPFQPATADNRENINYFSTGPDFTMGLGSQMRLRLGARYSIITYEEDPLDSTIAGGLIGIERSLSSRTTISLNANMRQVEYDNPVLNSDFDQLDTYFRYDAHGPRTNLAIDAGYTQLEREAPGNKENGALLRLDLSRRVSASSTVGLSGGREISTSAGAFASDLGAHGGVSTSSGRQTAEPFTLDRASVSWGFARGVTGLSLTADWSERTYEDDPSNDQTNTYITARMRRDLSPTTTLNFSIAQMGAKYRQNGTNYDEFSAGVTYSWRMARDLTLDVKYDYADRSGDATLNVFKENHLWIALSYGRGEPRGERHAPTFGIDTAQPEN